MPSVQTAQHQQADDWSSMEPECWDPKGPIIEALRLLALLETAETVDDVRRLIAVPHHLDASLRAFIAAHREQSFEIEHMLSFRREVAKAFERFVSMRQALPSVRASCRGQFRAFSEQDEIQQSALLSGESTRNYGPIVKAPSNIGSLRA